ncbi:response regulator transcription factor [Allopusillimonas soli]|uniref:Response regulator transcription factor n=1 Tax=Allopusillimonas soli TaxID=659016 RepID=A0A853FI15_9BURK|nr:LuxR C-terminal-related transcriptional regulator [Allopusillimonas soli]NYT37616.1 response regulator transcription factor [Allopusillimonas soli]TEA74421.1 response regulator transcription factor [Allopusillimonas soli]
MHKTDAIHTPPCARLTPRERDVMNHIARGELNKTIAAALGVSQRTVEAHRARVFQKLQVRNAVQLVRRILQQGGPA